jgi:hypothetical protein
MKKITLLFLFVLVSFGVQAQDTCATALPVTAGVTSVGAINGTEIPDPICAANGAGATAGEWYSYTPSQLEVVTINTNLAQNDGLVNSDDTRVHIYTGSCGALTCVGGNDDISGTNYLSNAQFLAEAGITYYIAFDDRWSGQGFDFELTVDVPNCNTSFPYTENFDSSVDFTGCYTVIDQDANGTAWIQQELELQPLVPSFFSTNGSNAGTKEDYLFTPAFTLTAGNTYDFTFKYNGADAANGVANEDIEILVAQGPTVADANAGTSIFTDTGVSQNGVFEDVEVQALTGTGSFTPTTSGDYHFVFKSTGSPLTIGGTTGFLLVFEYSVDETLSVDDFNTVDFNYFVDAQNILNLNANEALSQVKLYNMLGQEVMSKNLYNQNEAIDINALNTGVYLAKVQINNAVETFKFVKK